jgi:hypothetical protein
MRSVELLKKDFENLVVKRIFKAGMLFLLVMLFPLWAFGKSAHTESLKALRERLAKPEAIYDFSGELRRAEQFYAKGLLDFPELKKFYETGKLHEDNYFSKKLIQKKLDGLDRLEKQYSVEQIKSALDKLEIIPFSATGEANLERIAQTRFWTLHLQREYFRGDELLDLKQAYLNQPVLHFLLGKAQFLWSRGGVKSFNRYLAAASQGMSKDQSVFVPAAQEMRQRSLTLFSDKSLGD